MVGSEDMMIDHKKAAIATARSYTSARSLRTLEVHNVGSDEINKQPGENKVRDVNDGSISKLKCYDSNRQQMDKQESNLC